VAKFAYDTLRGVPRLLKKVASSPVIEAQSVSNVAGAFMNEMLERAAPWIKIATQRFMSENQGAKSVDQVLRALEGSVPSELHHIYMDCGLLAYDSGDWVMLNPTVRSGLFNINYRLLFENGFEKLQPSSPEFSATFEKLSPRALTSALAARRMTQSTDGSLETAEKQTINWVDAMQRLFAVTGMPQYLSMVSNAVWTLLPANFPRIDHVIARRDPATLRVQLLLVQSTVSTASDHMGVPVKVAERFSDESKAQFESASTLSSVKRRVRKSAKPAPEPDTPSTVMARVVEKHGGDEALQTMLGEVTQTFNSPDVWSFKDGETARPIDRSAAPRAAAAASLAPRPASTSTHSHRSLARSRSARRLADVDAQARGRPGVESVGGDGRRALRAEPGGEPVAEADLGRDEPQGGVGLEDRGRGGGGHVAVRRGALVPDVDQGRDEQVVRDRPLGAEPAGVVLRGPAGAAEAE
jgi:hypothetical protein